MVERVDTIAEQIAELIHRAFTSRSGVIVSDGVLGASQSATTTRSDLMRLVALLKDGRADEELLSQIDGLVRTAHAVGVVTDEVHNQILELLGEIEPKRTT